MITNELVVAVDERDHIAGSLDAPVLLVEYGDFECPHCGRAYPIVEAARRQLGKNMAFVYRHFPLAEIHPHAVLAAEAAEAAGAQGKFWPMHHMLYEHQDALERDDLLAYGRALQLDLARYARELAGETHAAKVRDDFRQGVRSGVNGTPTFFINGVRFDGDWSDPTTFIAALAQAARMESRPTIQSVRARSPMLHSTRTPDAMASIAATSTADKLPPNAPASSAATIVTILRAAMHHAARPVPAVAYETCTIACAT